MRNTLAQVVEDFYPGYFALAIAAGIVSLLAKVGKFSFLFPLSRCFFYLALISWLLTFFGLIRRSARLGGLITSPRQDA
jgi:hypothetical protein